MLKLLSPVLALCLILTITDSFGQQAGKDSSKTQSSKLDTAKVAPTLITADSLSSGSYKDIFISFFQLAFKDLTGPSKTVTFNSNPYAIMLKHNDSLAYYKYYRKYTWLRRLNFSVGAKLDSSYRFNGLTAGLTFAIVDNRDITVQHQFIADVYRDSIVQLYFNLADQVSSLISMMDISKRASYRNAYHKFFNDTTVKFSSLDSGFRVLVISVCNRLVSDSLPYAQTLKKLIQTDASFNLKQLVDSPYLAHKAYYQNRGLWTVGITDTSYSTGIFSKNVQLTTEYIKGLTNPKKIFNFQIDFKTAVNFTDDSLQAGQNLSREIFTFTPGLNFVLNGKTSHTPWLEFDVSGCYTNVWKGLYAKETQIVNTINGTLRILVTDNIWIPLTIKYDPKTGNVFGLLNVTTNFTGLGNLFGGNSKGSGKSS